MNVWLVFIGCGMVTFFSRGSFLLFGDRLQMPAGVQRALAHVGPAAFAAIAVPAALGADRFGALAPPTPEVIATVLAAGVVVRTRNMAAALVVGMVSLWLLRWFGL